MSLWNAAYNDGWWTSNTLVNPVWTGTLSTVAGTIAMGTTPPTGGAINIDNAAYTNAIVLSNSGGSGNSIFQQATTSLVIGPTNAGVFILQSGGQQKWQVQGGSNVSEWASVNVTARIIGGSSNGLSIRNSGNTRDNVLIADAGGLITITDGTNVAVFAASSSSGDMSAGARFRGSGGTWLNESSGAAGSKIGIAYYNGTNYISALEVLNVSSGSGTLALMKGGGAVVIGTDPGGSALIRGTGNIFFSGSLTIGSGIVSNNSGSEFILAVNANATSATSGYVYVNACAGAPTGVPGQAGAGKIAISYDTTNHKIWFYDQPAAAWKGVVVA